MVYCDACLSDEFNCQCNGNVNLPNFVPAKVVVSRRCHECDGSGYCQQYSGTDCRGCNGSGEVCAELVAIR